MPQPVNEPASNEASGSRHVFRWTMRIPDLFPDTLDYKKLLSQPYPLRPDD